VGVSWVACHRLVDHVRTASSIAGPAPAKTPAGRPGRESLHGVTAVVRACLVALLALVGALLPVPGAVAAGAGSATISGRILSLSGSALPGTTGVRLAMANGDGSWHFEGQPTPVSPNGSFSVSGLAPGTYRLQAENTDGRSYTDKWWIDAGDFETAQDIVLGPGGSELVTMALGPSGSISGTVLGPDGRPVEGVLAQAYTTGSSQYRRSDETDADGRYTITGIQVGTYKVEFRDQSGRLAGEFWNDTLTFQTATDVPVETDRTTTLGATTLALPVSISQPGPTLPGAGTGTGTAAVITVTQRPRIVGRTRVGRTLRVRPGTWSPAAVNLTYQWFARGVAIERATTSTLRLTRALRGKRIQVQVTASRLGSMPVMAASPRTTRVEPRR